MVQLLAEHVRGDQRDAFFRYEETFVDLPSGSTPARIPGGITVPRSMTTRFSTAPRPISTFWENDRLFDRAVTVHTHAREK